MKTVKTIKSKTEKIVVKAPAVKAPAVKAPVVKTPAAKAPAAAPARKQAVKAPTAKTHATPSVAPKRSVTPKREITPEVIAARAYVIWEQKGRPHGCDLENWLLAESQLKQEVQSFTA